MVKKIRKPTSGIVGKDEKFDNSKFFMEHGVDLEKRTISIYQEIDKDVCVYIRGIKKMLEVNNNYADEASAIDIEIASPGGDVYYGNALYDAIVECPVTVRTHGQGLVMSIALIVYLAGDERYASSHVTFMAHSISGETVGKEFEQNIDIKELKRLNRQMYEMLEESTNQGAAWWSRKIKAENFNFDYDKALELGVITNEYEENE